MVGPRSAGRGDRDLLEEDRWSRILEGGESNARSEKNGYLTMLPHFGTIALSRQAVMIDLMELWQGMDQKAFGVQIPSKN